MANPEIKIVAHEGVSRAINTFILAFASDPLVRWCWPDPNQYLNVMPRMVMAYAGQAFDLGTAHMEENYRGVALWFPPGVERNDEDLLALDKETLSKEKRDKIYSAEEKLEQFQPKDPHWYLALAAVDPNYHSKGIGSALLKFALSKCDENGSKAYLESSNPRNISLYERHGFEVLGEVTIADGPIYYPMSRQAN